MKLRSINYVWTEKKRNNRVHILFNEIEAWHNLPDSFDKFLNLSVKYHILSEAMSRLKDLQTELSEFQPGAYSPISMAEYFLSKSEFYRQKQLIHRSQEQIDDDIETNRMIDDLIESVGRIETEQDAAIHA